MPKKNPKRRARRGDQPDEDFATIRPAFLVTRDHIAQNYAEVGAPDTAADLTRGLRPWARFAVLGA